VAAEMVFCALGKSAAIRRTCENWYRGFREGDEFNLKNRECPGQPEKFQELQCLLDQSSVQAEEELDASG